MGFKLVIFARMKTPRLAHAHKRTPWSCELNAGDTNLSNTER